MTAVIHMAQDRTKTHQRLRMLLEEQERAYPNRLRADLSHRQKNGHARSGSGSAAGPATARREMLRRGGERRWRQRTPAMAAGLTDHIWSFEGLFDGANPHQHMKGRLPQRGS